MSGEIHIDGAFISGDPEKVARELGPYLKYAGLGPGAEATSFPQPQIVEVDPLLEPTVLLQPLDQLLAVFATLAGHGIVTDHIVYAHNLPRALYDSLPGEDDHGWVDDQGEHWMKRLRVGQRVTVTLYTREAPPSAESGAGEAA